jgi:hypothetical protein
MRIWPKTRTWRILSWIVLVFIAYSIGTYFGVPALFRYVARNQASAALHRRVTVGRVTFHPYKLRLVANKLRISERDTNGDFVYIGRVVLRLSWSSLYRFAVVLKRLSIEHPSVYLIRYEPQTFNFSDLLQAAPAPQQPSKPRQFALANIRLTDGKILFDDHVFKHQHRVDKIRLQIPFIANLPTDVETYVEPLLQMTVDGSPFAILGKTKPFGSTRESVVNVGIHQLDLTQYTDYAPVKLPVKLISAILSTAVDVSFVELSEKPEIHVSGTAGLEDVAVQNTSNDPLVEMKSLQVATADLEPLGRLIHLSSIKIDSLTPHLRLNHDGSTNFTPLLSAPPRNPSVKRSPSQDVNSPPSLQTPGAKSSPRTSSSPVASQYTPPVSSATPSTAPTLGQGSATTPTAASSSAAAVTPVSEPSPAAPPPSLVAAAPIASPTPAIAGNRPANSGAPNVLIDSIQLNDSAIDANVLTGALPVLLKLQGIHARVSNFTNAATIKPPSYDVNATLASGGRITAGGDLNLAGSAATLKLGLNQIDIPSLQGLAQSALAGIITSGKVSGDAVVNVGFAPGHFNVGAQPSELRIDGFGVRAPNAQQNVIGWKHFDVELAKADFASRNATVQEIRTDGLQLTLERDRRGDINLLSLIRGQTEPGEKPSSGRPKRRATFQSRSRQLRTSPQTLAKPTNTGWQYTVGLVALENTQASLLDQVGRQRVNLQIAPLNINLRGISHDLAKPIGVELDGRINRKGTFKIAGNAVIQPLKAQLRVETQRLDVASLDPFVASQLNTRIMRLELTMKGDTLAAMRRNKIEASYRGNLALRNVRIRDKLTGEDLLKWQALHFERMDLRYGAGQPRVHIGTIVLSDFYSRVILNSNGQLNLRDVVSNPGKAPVSVTRAHGELPTAPLPTASPSAAPAPQAAVTTVPAPAPSPIPANIEIGAITLEGGQVNYTDNFIKPNYSADLTELDGKVGSFGTHSTTPADVSLSGKVNGSSPIAISGSINPLTPFASVDIKANASGVELTPLATYTTKYTGYPITEGTLTVDVRYQLANEQLTAQNHIILDQLTFGDRVANSTARNLPIRLAVALLKDSSGRIDLNIPVSGSLSDPQFSIGGVIWHAVLNLLLRAATSPFSLIGSLAGGANQNLSYIEFAPGYATLTDTATAKLDTVAKALQQKSSLKLIITGAVDPALDRDGLRAAMLDYAIRRSKTGIEGSATKADLDKVKVTRDEYNKYLRRVYKAADFKKPEDVVGLTKSLPPEQMKKLILANTKITDEDLRNLANARAAAVRKQLVAKIRPERLQTHAPRLTPNGSAAKTPTTVTDLSLQ